MDIKGWFIVSGVGILFRIFPAWWWCSAMIADAIVNGKRLASWLKATAETIPLFGVIHVSTVSKNNYLLVLRIISITWIAICLIGCQYLSIPDFKEGNITRILEIETSFPVFVVLTVIVPAYFLKKYLRRIT
jgi:hypothetical protein